MSGLRAEVAGRSWYHTLELAPGVVTPGWFDLRGLPARLPLGDLRGARCLDVGTFDGFWAFEMERRGAREVLAIDVLDPGAWDWPAGASPATVTAIGGRKDGGAGFEVARRALASRVDRHEGSVYDLRPDALGTFDLVFVGSLLLHLRDPVAALAAVRSVCAGRMLSLDAYDLGLTLRHPRRPVAALDARGRPWWWKGNLAALRRMAEAAGFDVVDGPHPTWMPAGAGQPPAAAAARRVHRREARAALLARLKGEPHAWTLAAPARTPR